MSATATDLAPSRRGRGSWLWRRQLDTYPSTGPRVFYLAITVLATVTLYYELYVGGSVATLLLTNLHMSFTFYVVILAFGNLVGAFGSLFAGLADRWGRANLVVGGLLLTGVFTAFIIPAATTKWAFGIEFFVLGLIEGVCLVATPALIRDFSPQVGRATAMGFWTTGPVLGSLIVAVVASHTVPAVVRDPRFWTHEFRICGIAGLVMFVIALVGLKELAPRLRDQLMVTMRDRALIEARAKGIDIEAALRHPFRQLLKPDVVVSAIAVSVMLLIYYTAVGFSVIYLSTMFGFSVKDANGLGNWNWGFNVIAVVLIGVISDRVRVRKPFMVLGGVLAAVMTVVYLEQAGHHPSYYELATILAIGAFFLGVAYAPWMASYTETVEARNPALIATGLAIWGWIVRVVIFIAFLIIPAVINSVTPLVSYGSTVIRVYDPVQEPDRVRAEPPAGRRHRHAVQDAAGQRAEVRPRAGGDPGQPGPVRQAGRLPEPGRHPPEAGRAGRHRRGRGRQGDRRPHHHQRQQRRHPGRHRRRPQAGHGRAVRGPADRVVQGPAAGVPVSEGARRLGPDGRLPGGRPVEGLVLGVLRRDHRLPAQHPAASGPLEALQRAAGRGGARGDGDGRAGQARHLTRAGDGRRVRAAGSSG